MTRTVADDTVPQDVSKNVSPPYVFSSSTEPPSATLAASVTPGSVMVVNQIDGSTIEIIEDLEYGEGPRGQTVEAHNDNEWHGEQPDH